MNIEAAELVGGLHGQLEKAGFTGIDLEKFLVRIVFCLFADDTCVSGMGNLFSIGWSNEHQKMRMTLGLNYLDLSKHLTHQKKSGGALLDESLSDFVYVNGDLFDGATRIPAFNSEMRKSLIVACRFDWSTISSAIFGSLFQSVINRESAE